MLNYDIWDTMQERRLKLELILVNLSTNRFLVLLNSKSNKWCFSGAGGVTQKPTGPGMYFLAVYFLVWIFFRNAGMSEFTVYLNKCMLIIVREVYWFTFHY